METNNIGVQGASGVKYVVADSELNIVEKSSDELFDKIDASKLRLTNGEEVTLPVSEELLCEYTCENGESCALRIRPEDSDRYHIDIFYKSDAALIAEASGVANDIRKGLGGMKRDLADIRQYFELALAMGTDTATREEEDRFVKDSLIRSMSNIVNFYEVMGYLNNVSRESSDCFVSVVADDLCGQVERRISGEDTVLKKNIDKTCHIRANSNRFRVVLANLIVNAYMYNDSSVKECTLSIRRIKGGVCISVEDNGRGFDGNNSGSGLGLVLARQFCSLYGGELEITSQQGKGTCVSMTFMQKGEESGRSFSQVPDVAEDEVDSVQYVLSKYFRGRRLNMEILMNSIDMTDK